MRTHWHADSPIHITKGRQDKGKVSEKNSWSVPPVGCTTLKGSRGRGRRNNRSNLLHIILYFSATIVHDVLLLVQLSTRHGNLTTYKVQEPNCHASL
jgi:hypothetical protein